MGRLHPLQKIFRRRGNFLSWSLCQIQVQSFMKILLIDNGTKHLKRLIRLLSGNEIEIVPLFSDYPNLKTYDLVVLSGGSMFSIVTNPEAFSQEINLIKSSNKPIIGICQGCEIIAYALGSKLVLINPKARGVKNIEFVKNPYLNFTDPIKVYEAHHWAVKKLGKDLIGIAKSKSGYEIIKSKSHEIWGLQFHPEMLLDKTVGDEIFTKVVQLINEKQ